jgi:hypothetical protein
MKRMIGWESVFGSSSRKRFLSTFAVTTIAAFTVGCAQEKIDCVRNPQSVVGQCYGLNGGHAVLASSDRDRLWALEYDLDEGVNSELQARQRKTGSTAGAVVSVAMDLKSKKYADLMLPLKNAIQSGLVQDANVDATAGRNSEDLNLVVVRSYKADTKVPLLCVRFTNKRFAGQELWIAASTLRSYGHPVNFNK